ncbi:MAG: asparagine synthase (glutamine-hydrolyzing), partial [Mariniblastus sp.]|nr:asparagine synthase (glutamine-hydrolyzing) [Mariniblastus sp.]
MCGICGIVFRDPQQSVQTEMLTRMNDLLTHRGPDGSGLWTEANIGLAHRRLSLIDLSENGRQPMVDPSTGSVLTYNGEIYNFRELKTEFLSGTEFQSRTDSEVLLKLLASRGKAAVDLLEGMFAFAFYDHPAKRLLLARDPFGIKPLYYSIQPGQIVFGSELKAIMASGLVSRELDHDALNDFFDFTFIPAPRSIYRNVQKLEPGHLMSIDLTEWTVTSQCFWQPAYTPQLGRSTSCIIDQAEDALRQSVKQQLVADVPVGSFLSGGIDSTLVTAAAAGQSDALSAFTVDFEGALVSEASQAEDLASQMGV